MSTLNERIVETAMSWTGTPFMHQGRLRGQGIDCAGFIAEVAREAGIKDVEIPHNYRPKEDGILMLKILREHMEVIPIEEAQAGDVLALCDPAVRHPDIPRHLVIVKEVTPITTFIIHAGPNGVVSHRIDGAWKRRIHSCWRIRE